MLWCEVFKSVTDSRDFKASRIMSLPGDTRANSEHFYTTVMQFSCLSLCKKHFHAAHIFAAVGVELILGAFFSWSR